MSKATSGRSATRKNTNSKSDTNHEHTNPGENTAGDEGSGRFVTHFSSIPERLKEGVENLSPSLQRQVPKTGDISESMNDRLRTGARRGDEDGIDGRKASPLRGGKGKAKPGAGIFGHGRPNGPKLEGE
jgi:hypothetical protein